MSSHAKKISKKSHLNSNTNIANFFKFLSKYGKKDSGQPTCWQTRDQYGTNQNTVCSYSQNSTVLNFTVHFLLVTKVCTKMLPMCHFHSRTESRPPTWRQTGGLHSINNMTHPFKTNARISIQMTTESNWLQWNEIQHGVLIKSAYSTCRCQTSNINEGGETSLRSDHIMGHSNEKYNWIQVNIVPTSPYISNVSSDCTLLVWMLQWGHEVTNWRSPWQHWQSIFMGPKKKNFWVKGWVTLKDSAVKI